MSDCHQLHLFQVSLSLFRAFSGTNKWDQSTATRIRVETPPRPRLEPELALAAGKTAQLPFSAARVGRSLFLVERAWDFLIWLFCSRPACLRWVSRSC